jgi:hypothetical protein
MRLVRKFMGYSALERRLVVRAWFAVALVRILLWVAPYQWLEAWLLKPVGVTSGTASPVAVALSVTRAATLVPGATCLVQALAGGWLIRREGGRAVLRFGVAKDDAGFKAHAWLEGEGGILIGGSTAGGYLPLAHADDGRR